MSGYDSTLELIVRVGDGKTYKKYDLCALIRPDQGVVIEFKMNEGIVT